MAFHRGTRAALTSLGYNPDVISTVSGGSVFGAMWMVSRLRDEDRWDDRIVEVLRRGFVRSALRIRPRLLRALSPFGGYNRTRLLADVFDDELFGGVTLGELPEAPALCMHAAMMNHGRVAKLTRQGISGWGLHHPQSEPSHQVPATDFRLAEAVAASAAFPVGLPPFVIPREDLPPNTELVGDLKGAEAIALTDGGVLENLGAQTLLQSPRFGCWNLVISDAGTYEDLWHHGHPANTILGFLTWLLSGPGLTRVMLMMNSKQNRWMRQMVFEQLEASWLVGSLEEGASDPLSDHLAPRMGRARRIVLMARVAQTWSHLLSSLPSWRLRELGCPQAAGQDAATAEACLREAGIDLEPAREHHARLGQDGERRVNAVATSFTALDDATIDALFHHAAWQIHATHAIFGSAMSSSPLLSSCAR